MAALVLEVAKNGPKLEPVEDSAGSTQNGRGLIEAKVITMTRFAEVLSRQTDVPVVDRTGLEGSFNLKSSFRPENARATDEAMDRPALVDAVQQQLGLRLESRKMPIEVLVIDHAEKPSEN